MKTLENYIIIGNRNDNIALQIWTFCANTIIPGVSEGILRTEHESGGLFGPLITDLHSDLKNFEWRMQYGGQVNLTKFYKPLAKDH